MKYILPILLIILTGCTFRAGSLAKRDTAITERTRELVSGASVAVSSTGNAIAQTNWLAAVRANGVASDQLDRAKRLIGEPVRSQRFEMLQLIESTNEVEIVIAQKREERRRSEENGWYAERARLQADLVEMGAKYEAERNKSIVKRAWAWGVGTFGVAGFIAFCVFCPAIGIPLVGRLLGWIVSTLPTLAGYIGVIGTKAVTGIVNGVEAAKSALDEKAKTTLEENLSWEMDANGKKIVRAIKP